MNMPRVVVEAFAIEDDGARRSLGDVDLTYAVVQDMMPHGRPREMTFPPMAMALSPSLDDDMRGLAFAGRLALPSFEAAVSGFLEAIGGLEGVPAAKKHLHDLADARRSLESSQRLLDVVAKARLAAAVEFEMYGTPFHGDRDFVSDIDEAYDGYRWDEFAAANPMPETGAAERTGWEAAHRAWVRTVAPPFVFGTRKVRWAGVDEAAIRIEREENDRVDVAALIENEMSDHFDQAHDHLVDVPALEAIVAEWDAHAGSGDEVDKGLGEKLSAWNARQSIVSFHEDRSAVVPAFDGVGMAGIREWVEGALEGRRAFLVATENGWEPPIRPGPAI